MNAEQLAIARRLVACPRWVWLPGMAAFRPYHAGHLRIESTHESGFGMSPVFHGSCSWFSLSGLVPDLDDELTRLGSLAVVRRAHRDKFIGITKAGNEWAVTMAYTEIISGEARMAILCRGSTEIEALCLALEAAP